jgi:hypothetical protein
MNKHFEFAKNLRRKGASWKISTKQHDESDEVADDSDDTGEDSDDENNRTRDWAIEEACKILKRSRGREVCHHAIQCHSCIEREADMIST